MALTYLAATYANNMLSQITTTGTFMSLNTASPGTTGANEFGSYTGARPAITWAGASSGVVVSNDTQTFALTATAASGLTYFGIWNASTGGTYLCGGTTSGLSGSIPSGANVTVTSAITLTQAG
jgi:hypothetical protein